MPDGVRLKPPEDFSRRATGLVIYKDDIEDLVKLLGVVPGGIRIETEKAVFDNAEAFWTHNHLQRPKELRLETNDPMVVISFTEWSAWVHCRTGTERGNHLATTAYEFIAKSPRWKWWRTRRFTGVAWFLSIATIAILVYRILYLRSKSDLDPALLIPCSIYLWTYIFARPPQTRIFVNRPRSESKFLDSFVGKVLITVVGGIFLLLLRYAYVAFTGHTVS